jgi:hypothetical protein
MARRKGKPRSPQGMGEEKKWVEERDYLLDVANEQLLNLRYAYKQVADRQPIVLFDIQEQRIYVYPTRVSRTT